MTKSFVISTIDSGATAISAGARTLTKALTLALTLIKTTNE